MNLTREKHLYKLVEFENGNKGRSWTEWLLKDTPGTDHRALAWVDRVIQSEEKSFNWVLFDLSLDRIVACS